MLDCNPRDAMLDCNPRDAMLDCNPRDAIVTDCEFFCQKIADLKIRKH